MEKLHAIQTIEFPGLDKSSKSGGSVRSGGSVDSGNTGDTVESGESVDFVSFCESCGHG